MVSHVCPATLEKNMPRSQIIGNIMVPDSLDDSGILTSG